MRLAESSGKGSDGSSPVDEKNTTQTSGKKGEESDEAEEAAHLPAASKQLIVSMMVPRPASPDVITVSNKTAHGTRPKKQRMGRPRTRRPRSW